MERNKLLVAVVIILILEEWWCSGCLENERIALLQLKASINFPNGASLSSWKIDHDDCCKWDRVTCSDTTGRVTKLYLAEVRDEKLGNWYINTSLFLPFQKLNSLVLYGNQIVGCIESEGFERLFELIYLEILSLSVNKLNNSVFSSLGVISSLKLLYLHNNQLKGTIDIQELQKLNKLEFLDLSGNQLDNNILSSLKGLPSLSFLYIRHNQLKGSVDVKGLNALTNLRLLDLSGNAINKFVSTNNFATSKDGIDSSNLKILYLDNVIINKNRISLRSLGVLFPNLNALYIRESNLEGTIISQELHTLRNLEVLFLDGSSLNGNFLNGIGVLSSLKVLSLYHCGLNNPLPNPGWCELNKLEELNLSSNDFEGILPSCLGSMSHLRVLDISNNQFNGNIASSPLTKLRSLEFLSLSNNTFQIPISFGVKSFGNISNLKVLLIDSNQLIVEPEYQAWTPTFQLKVFSMSNCMLGKPPNFLYHQHDLRIVDLSSNNFNEMFPSWLFKNNTRLERAILSNNSFMGPLELPSHSNVNLSGLDISINSLQGQIPPNISSIFPNLVTLSSSENSFESSIPPHLSKMSSLEVLDLSNNNLSGEIPEQLASGCFSLRFLKLSNNNLTGKMLPIKTNLPRLSFLLLDGNNFSGKITDALSRNDLIHLDISNNQLSGELPTWLGNVRFLERLSLSKNHFVGRIPIEFCNWEHLLSLDLSENNLFGSIPSCFRLPNIEQVHLNGNKLSGSLEQAFCNCSGLVTLDLSDNELTGIIPDWIDSISSLSTLLLNGNHFIGEIPTALCQLHQLRIIDLSENDLLGHIPACLSNLTLKGTQENSIFSFLNFGFGGFKEPGSYVEGMTLTVKYNSIFNRELIHRSVKEQIEFTTKKRLDTYEGRVLKYMSGIDFSCNRLVGEIPPELGNLSELHALNLSHNNLDGSIPTTFSQLKQIESLDLSFNNLSGRIPPQLIELYAMGTFIVAHNNLSGAIPDGKAQFGTFNESSYEGNPFLCGPPLHNSCSETEAPLPVPARSDVDGEDSEFIDKKSFYISFVLSYTIVLLVIAAVLYINPYWRQAWFYYVEVCITNCRRKKDPKRRRKRRLKT